jgi:hypothetical protein
MENTQTNTGREYPVLDALVAQFKHTVETIDKALEPSGQVAAHFRQARIEFLKGVRQILDNRIENLQRRDESGTKIDVE